MSVEGGIMCAMGRMAPSWVCVPRLFMVSFLGYMCYSKPPRLLCIAVLEELPCACFAGQAGM
jgi:hypothetical protein